MKTCIKMKYNMHQEGKKLRRLAHNTQLHALEHPVIKAGKSKEQIKDEWERACGGNIAAMEFQPSTGKKGLLNFPIEPVFANSGVSKSDNMYAGYFTIISGNKYFTSLKVSPDGSVNCKDGCWSRHSDTEIKLLEYAAKKFIPNGSVGDTIEHVSGRLNLYTKLKPCLSCEVVMLDFGRMFPNVTVYVYWEDTPTFVI